MDAGIIDSVAVAIITGLCTSIATIVSSRITNSKSQALLNYRLDKLEEKVDVHNHVVQRVAILEERIKDLIHGNNSV